jgi:hypothetical protein
MGLSTATQLPVLTRCEFLDTAIEVWHRANTSNAYLLLNCFKWPEKGTWLLFVGPNRHSV